MGNAVLIGLAITLVGGFGGAYMLFGQRTDSLQQMMTTTSPTVPAGSTTSSSRSRSSGIKIRWYQRLKAFALLLLIAIGIGTAIGAVLGAIALMLSILVN